MSVHRKNVASMAFGGAFRGPALALLVTALGSAACSSGMDTASEFQADSVQAQVNAYVANANNNTVAVIDTASNTITATVPVGQGPVSLALTPDRAFLYVANSGDSTVSVVGTATNAVAATVPVGNTPFGIAVTPDGAFAYVANLRGNSVSVIATASNTVTATIPVGRFPEGVAITPDGAFAYVVDDGDKNVSVIATATNTVITTVPVGNVPGPVAVSPDGTLVYVGDIVTPPSTGGVTVIATATNTVIASVATSNQPFGIAFTPSGAFAYVANFVGSSVSVVDTATTTVTATISSAQASTPAGVAITPDGAFAYTVNFNSNNVSAIDTATNTIVAIIPGLVGPEGIAITPNSAPKASCHDVTAAAGPSCTATASIDNGSVDPDGDPLTLSQAPAAPYSLGATGVTLTATDNFGASGRCTATVTVVDSTPPAITCPADITAKGNIPDSPFANVDPGTPTATDNCPGLTVVGTRSDGEPLNAPYPFGTTTITQTATDGGGNQSSCQQTVTVVANTPTSKDQCKQGGWRTFTNPTFKNQGDCVSFVEHE
jgi:YVTN family beta-propeller protein